MFSGRPPHRSAGWFDRLASTFFGGSCLLCRGASAHGLLCDPCLADLPPQSPWRCARCALPLAEGTPAGMQCGRCLSEPPAFDATLAAWTYAFPADVLLQSLKFRGELALAPLLGQALADTVRDAPQAERDKHSVHLALPVPLHATRLAMRGHNHALEIGRTACKLLGVKLDPFACERTRDTPPQAGLALAERTRNLRGAFACKRGGFSMRGLSVAVIDDVMTSGSTLQELAVTLKAAGAARVVNWVVARTPEPGY